MRRITPHLLLDRRRVLVGGMAAVAAAVASPVVARSLHEAQTPIVWRFDQLDRIGGLVPHIEGHPQIIDSPLGKATLFNGVDDALFLDRHPLAGAETFTFEALIRPDGGAFEQRFMHLAADETVPPPTKPLNTRFLFEIRVVKDAWYLDAFTQGPGYKQTLAFPDKRFPIGQWYHVAQTYDGKAYRSFVNGVEQGEAYIDFQPQGPGKTSVGARMNHVNYFKGAIREARFTPRALTPDAFLKLPAFDQKGTTT